jgi:deoxyribonuclease V
MRVKPIHSWDITKNDAIPLQKKLAQQTRFTSLKKDPKIIAGTDISFQDDTAYAGAVLFKLPNLEPISNFIYEGKVAFPYFPGLLSFREAPILLELFKLIKPAPDLVFFDGHGLAHPRKLGLASHIGLFLQKPTIGCGKSRLYGSFEDPPVSKGTHSQLLNPSDESIGAVVRTKERCKPIFVSPGHLIDLNDAISWTLRCVSKYRIPEPTRLAHNFVTDYKRQKTKQVLNKN